MATLWNAPVLEGDRVWSPVYGFGIVRQVDGEVFQVFFGRKELRRFRNGREGDSPVPVLFWDAIPERDFASIAPPKPQTVSLDDLKQGDEVLVMDTAQGARRAQFVSIISGAGVVVYWPLERRVGLVDETNVRPVPEGVGVDDGGEGFRPMPRRR